MAVSAVDAVRRAFDHAVAQLFKPFRLGQWTRLAIVGLLAGEFPFNSGFNFTRRFGSRGTSSFLEQGRILPFGALGPVAVVLAIILGVILLIAIVVAFIYINSMMRFVLFDSVVARECHIRRFWRARLDQGFRYFIWQLLLAAIVWTGIGTIVATAVLVGLRFGLFRSPREHLLPLILGGLLLFIVFLVAMVFVIAVAVLTKDFVVPQMALENVGVVDGWNRLLPMMQHEPWPYAGYLGLKFLLNIAAVAVMAIAFLTLLVAVIVVLGPFGLAGFLAARLLGLGWNLFTVAAAILLGLIAVSAMVYGAFLEAVPLIVFFPAYSIYFFADRYEPLRRAVTPVPGDAGL